MRNPWDYATDWIACDICGVKQQRSWLNKVDGIGHVCKNQEDCKRWREMGPANGKSDGNNKPGKQ